VLTLLTPVAARLDYLAVVVLRVLLGLMLVTYRLQYDLQMKASNDNLIY
jgi:hypothetical protein